MLLFAFFFNTSKSISRPAKNIRARMPKSANTLITSALLKLKKLDASTPARISNIALAMLSFIAMNPARIINPTAVKISFM